MSGPVPVVVSTAQKGDLPVYLIGLGSVTAFNTVTVRSRVDGQIVKVNFTEGQFVHEGDALIEIDPRPYQVMLEQAEGQLAKDQAQLHDVQVDFERYTSFSTTKASSRSSRWTRSKPRWVNFKARLRLIKPLSITPNYSSSIPALRRPSAAA